MVQRKILVVDDDAKVREMLVRFLKTSGYSVSSAADGLAGLEIAASVIPDLILADMEMPTVNGLAFFDLLRKSAPTATIPVLFITGDSKVGSIDDAMNRGAIGYVLKPFDFPDLAEAIKAAVGG